MDGSGFGRYVKRLREQRGFTQQELGEALGKRGSYVSIVESGKIGMPGPEVLAAMATELGVPEVELLRQIGYLQGEPADNAAPWPAHDTRAAIIELPRRVTDETRQQLILVAVKIATTIEQE